MSLSRRCLVCLIGVLVGAPVLGPALQADAVPPVTVQVKEQEAGKFLVQWRVPTMVPARAIPSPSLPGTCRSAGEQTMVERPGGWFLRRAYQCPDGISGRELGIDYPFLNTRFSTLLRVDLLSGERYAHMLVPGERSWSVPDSNVGGVPAMLRQASDAVLDGAGHFAGNGVHVAFLLSLALLGSVGVATRLVTVFTTGQIVAVVLFSFSGVRIGPSLADIGVAVAAVLLAREALRPAEERRQLIGLAAVAGLCHGLGIGSLMAPPAASEGSNLAYLLLFVLGMDTALLVSAMALAVLGMLVPRGRSMGRLQTFAVYAVAGLSLALALSPPVVVSGTRPDPAPSGLTLRGLTLPQGSAGGPASRRVATRFPDEALQSFVTVDAFEVRHEVLVRLAEVTGHVGLGSTREIAIDGQPDVKQRVRDLVATRTSVAIDGESIEPVEVRVAFLSLDDQGVLPRVAPVLEPVEEAWLGVTTVYLTKATPQDLAVEWRSFDVAESVPATLTDPESSRSVLLSNEQPALLWKNELSEDPTPVVRAVAVERATLPVPLLSLVPLGIGLMSAVAAWRGRRREVTSALARVMLGCALVLAPSGNVEVPLPFSLGSTPDSGRARRILTGVLPNVYRAFEFPTESAAYDRLALSVTGETLTEVYLGHRRSVVMEERGGARIRIEAVEILEADSVDPDRDGGFAADAVWTVGGTVTHFGHRHFRQNRYEARVAVVPVEGFWKIRSIEILDEKRLQ